MQCTHYSCDDAKNASYRQSHVAHKYMQIILTTNAQSISTEYIFFIEITHGVTLRISHNMRIQNVYLTYVARQIQARKCAMQII